MSPALPGAGELRLALLAGPRLVRLNP